jgi:hypothetical protein
MDVIIRYYASRAWPKISPSSSHTKPKPQTRLAKQFSAPPTWPGGPFFGAHSFVVSRDGAVGFSPPFSLPPHFPLVPTNGNQERPILGLFLPFSLGFPFLGKPQSKTTLGWPKQNDLQPPPTERRQWHRPFY